MHWILRPSQPLDQETSLVTRLRSFVGSYSTCFQRLLLLLLAGWTAYSWFLTAQKVLSYYSPLPNWDYWNVVQHLPAYRAFHIGVLWEQHNEHRIVFPEIIFAADMLLLHGRQILSFAISFLCHFSTWLVISCTLLFDRSLPALVRYSAALLAGIIIGWQGSAVALGIPFLLNWTLTQFASVLGLALLCVFKKSPRVVYLIGTILCGTVATYSSANGMMLWLVILIAALLLPIGGRYLILLTTAAITNIGLYFVGFLLSPALDTSKLLIHPFYLFGFLASYVSMPFGMFGSGAIGVWVGLANLGLFFVLIAITYRKGLLHSAPAIVLFGYFAFTLLTAALTAAGRMSPNDATFTAAKASRYITVPLVNWGALVIALIWLSAKCDWKLASARNMSVAVAVVVLITFPKFARWLALNDFVFARQQWATLSVENGLLDPQMIQYVFPDLNFVRIYLPEIRDYHLSAFASGHDRWLGEPLAIKFSGAPLPPQSGSVTYILNVKGGLEVVGWAEGSRSLRIIFVNELGRIVGLGGKLRAGFPPDLESSNTPSSLAWVGFINSKFPAKALSTYVIDRGWTGIAPIAGSSTVPLN